MRRLTASATLPFACAFVWAGAARAQGGRGFTDWMTAGGDAQRSSWVRTDPKISVSRVQKSGLQLAWKIKLNGEPSVAVTLDRYIGYRGFRSLALVSSRSGDVTAFDTDLGRIEWKKTLSPVATALDAGAPCSGGMTANVARPTAAAFPAIPAGRGGGGGRANFAKGAVGAPDEGAVTIAEMAARAAAAATAAAARGPIPAPVAAGRGSVEYNPYAARASFLNAISSDGMFHSMYISNGEEPAPPVAFLPANANAHGLIVLDNIAYATTSGSCGDAPNGVWALDLTSKDVAHWTPAAGDIAGSAAAFGPDRAAYVATTGGELVALEPKTLQVRATYHSDRQAFISSPVVFEYNKNTTIAAATADGRLHLVTVDPLAAASLTGAAYPAVVSGALASWQDAAGTRWLAAPSKDSIAAWKVTGEAGAPVLQPGWTSREIASPLAPIVVNGVVFAVSNSSPAVLYAFDGETGKELWNSGKTISAAIRNGGLSAIGGQLYLGASDGTFYAFGFPIEH